MNGFSVQTLCDGIAHISLMAERKTNGGASPASVALKKMREQAGLSVREVAAALGRKPSSYQHYEDVYKKPFLPFDLVRDLADIFAPYGVPRDAVLALAGLTHDAATHAQKREAAMSTLGERIANARTRTEYSQERVAKMLGVSRAAVAQWERGTAVPGVDRIKDLATVLGIDPAELAFGAPREGEPSAPTAKLRDDSLVLVNEREVRASAGGGAVVEAEDVNGTWGFPRDWLKYELRAKPADLDVITIDGDSMSPTLEPGDKVVVDRSRTAPSPPGVFIVWDGMATVAKRLEFIPNSDPPRVRILSDNPRYQPYERTAEEVFVLARVLGRWQRL